MNDKS
jgi:hypothetical protein